MNEDQSERIITQLATLTESVAGLRRDGERRDEAFEQERQDSNASRRDLHEKVNGVAIDLATLKGDVKAAVNTVSNLKTAVEKAAPTIADVENAKKFGAWILGGGAAAAIGTGLAIFAWGEAFKSWLAHWLGIK